MVTTRRVVVTGGASGIGAAIADRHRKAGDQVVVLDRTPLEDGSSVRVDVADHEDARAAIDRAAELAAEGARVAVSSRERGWGRIVAVSSASVREPIDEIVLSNAHRSGLLATFRTIARSVAGDGVTLNSLLTGQIATERLYSLRGGREAAERLSAEAVPAGRAGEPEEMAAAAAFLCSTRAAYITGEAIRVDGGLARAV